MSKKNDYCQRIYYSDTPQQLFLMKKDSIYSINSNYDLENDLNDIEQEKNALQNIYVELQYIVSHDEEDKKQKYFQNSDFESNEIIDFQKSENILPNIIEIPETDEIFICQNSESIQPEFIENNDDSKIPQQNIGEIKHPVNIPVEQKKFHDKSYCRYILLYVFRTIENKQYTEIITDICRQFQVNYNNFIEYYRKQRILIMGYKALKKELIYDNESISDQNRKKAFKEVLIWYLNTLATKHILLSKKQNFEEYLKFKNYVISYYVHNPKSWGGNKPQWK